MKRYLFLIVTIVFVSFLFSCSQNNETDLITRAYPLSDRLIKEKGLLNEFELINRHTLRYASKNSELKNYYVFSAPVDENQSVLLADDKSEHWLAESLDIKMFMPYIWSAQTPIISHMDNDSIEIMPDNGDTYIGIKIEKINAFGERVSGILYADAFGDGVDLFCVPMLFGINTEIIANPGKTPKNFNFYFRIPNNTPKIDSPDYITFNDNSGATKAILYTPIAVDTNNLWCYDNHAQLERQGNSEYIVSYSISSEFLQKTNSAVHINQSFVFSIPKQSDSSAYSNFSNSHYLSPYLLLGETHKGMGEAFIRYDILEEMTFDPEQILSVKYYFYNLISLPEPVTVFAHAINEEWCSMGMNWHDKPKYDETPLDTVVVQARGNYSIDITPLFIEWIKNIDHALPKYSIQFGFMLRSDTSDNAVMLASGDNGLYSPLLEIVVK